MAAVKTWQAAVAQLQQLHKLAAQHEQKQTAAAMAQIEGIYDTLLSVDGSNTQHSVAECKQVVDKLKVRNLRSDWGLVHGQSDYC